MPARILVVEDNPTNLELMVYLLKAFGYAPLEARDGVEGMEMARRERPDLILLDVHMPEMDGYEAARELKSDPALSAIPLVAVTALAMVGDREKVLAAGFDGYISKPLDPETFVRQVKGFLGTGSALGRMASVATTSGAPPPSPVKAKGITVLIVDNMTVNLGVLRGILEPSGYKVLSAHGVKEALELARQTPPDLILSDVHMPDLGGYDFIHAVKVDPRLRAIPFAFTSSTVWGEQDRVRALALGAAKFILRPIEPQEFLAEIEDCLRERKEK